ncbi:MAG: M14 family metallopeptidase [Spirochaetales bacterium]
MKQLAMATALLVSLVAVSRSVLGDGAGTVEWQQSAAVTRAHASAEESAGADEEMRREPIKIGESVEGRPLHAYRFGEGERHIVIEAGIHGGYEWVTIVLAEKLLDHFREHESEIPSTVSIHILPTMNPDGLQRVTGGEPLNEVDMTKRNTNRGRFNANNVDLNRNFDYAWKPTSRWWDIEVDAGSEPLSEPETRALRDYVEGLDPTPEVVVSLHSAAGGIYYGGREGYREASIYYSEIYAEASGYPVPDQGFTQYEITGSSSDYFASQGIPAITVELTSHEDPEFERNLAGIEALIAEIADAHSPGHR